MLQGLLAFCLLFFSCLSGAAQLGLQIADIQAPQFSAQGIKLLITDQGIADLTVKQFQLREQRWSNLHLRCASFSLSSVEMVCGRAKLDRLSDVDIQFAYQFSSKKAQLLLNMPKQEAWQLDMQLLPNGWHMALLLKQASLSRLISWLPFSMPKDLPLPTQGNLTGSLSLSADEHGLSAIQTDLLSKDVALSDATGLHAAEKMQLEVKLAAQRTLDIWQWHSVLQWQEGELFWQPVYLKSHKTAYALEAAGRVQGDLLHIEKASLNLPEADSVQFAGQWQIKQRQLLSAQLQAKQLRVADAFNVYAKPFFSKGVLAESSWYGAADVALNYQQGEIQSLQLKLVELGFADAARRFALLGVNSDIHWDKNIAHTQQIRFAGGRLLGVPLGGSTWQVQTLGKKFNVSQAHLPILDGALELRDFSLYQHDGDWHWQFSAELESISMEQFSSAAGWPKMHGSLAGSIPKVSYKGQAIDVDGALLFKVFDGEVMATQLKLVDAFGRAPRFYGDLNMRNIDLALLTSAFSFGNIQGKIDVDVQDLALQNWQLTGFNAKVSSSAGRYPKKISQKAVQNITALGGSGAVAALQRGYLSFFENFGYDQIGWSCMLHNGICEMGGLGDAKSSTYSIIKGAGIPAINVTGYNRRVGWDELIARLKRVIQNNTKPVIK